MLKDSLFSIDASTVTLGAVLARGSPGVTLYKADLQLGERSMDVSEPLSMQRLVHHNCYSSPLECMAGSSEEAADLRFS